MSYFPRTKKWLIPEKALTKSLAEMAVQGRLENEGTCLWLGKKDGSEAWVTHVVFLRGPGVTNTPENVEISAELMSEVHDRALELGITLIGQIHSHGPFHGVDLSPVDHRYGIRAPYFLSIVSPDYAQRESTAIVDCGIHVFLPHRGYKRLTENEIGSRIVITSDEIETLTVGNYE